MTIVEFLEARIAEDEAEAFDAPKMSDVYDASRLAFTEPIRRRVLAECASKRAIVELHLGIGYSEYCRTCSEGHGGVLNPCPTIRAIAIVYADSPDYPALENVGVLPE